MVRISEQKTLQIALIVLKLWHCRYCSSASLRLCSMLQQHPQIVTAVQALRCFHLFQVSRGTDVSLLLWQERLFLTVILLLVLFRGGWVVHLYTYLVKPSSQHCTYGSGHYRDPEPEFSSPTKRMTDISKQLGVTKNKG